MVEQQQRKVLGQEWENRRRQAGIVAFVVGLVSTLAVFAFCPGLPHVIDWGANSRRHRRGRARPVGLSVMDDESGRKEARRTLIVSEGSHDST
jgi:hypothetical protein